MGEFQHHYLPVTMTVTSAKHTESVVRWQGVILLIPCTRNCYSTCCQCHPAWCVGVQRSSSWNNSSLAVLQTHTTSLNMVSHAPLCRPIQTNYRCHLEWVGRWESVCAPQGVCLSCNRFWTQGVSTLTCGYTWLTAHKSVCFWESVCECVSTNREQTSIYGYISI